MCKNREGKAFVSCRAVQTLFKASYLQESTIKPRIPFSSTGVGWYTEVQTQTSYKSFLDLHDHSRRLLHQFNSNPSFTAVRSINSTQTGTHTGIFAQFVAKHGLDQPPLHNPVPPSSFDRGRWINSPTIHLLAGN